MRFWGMCVLGIPLQIPTAQWLQIDFAHDSFAPILHICIQTEYTAIIGAQIGVVSALEQSPDRIDLGALARELCTKLIRYCNAPRSTLLTILLPQSFTYASEWNVQQLLGRR